MTLRKVVLTAHLWTGLVSAPLLAILGLTGAVLVSENPLDDALNARLVRVASPGPLLPLAELAHRLEATHPGYRTGFVDFPADSGHAYGVSLSAADGRADIDLFVDPHDGRVLGAASEAREWIRPVQQFHTRLLAGRTGEAIVGWGSVTLVFLSLSGLWLWWPAKILSLKRGGSGRRVIFDLHNALGGLSWVLLLVFGLTGVVIHWDRGAVALATRLFGGTAPTPFPSSAPGCAGRPPLPIDQVLAAATAAVPGARATVIDVPAQAERPARVILKFPEDRTPAGRTNVFVASCTGRILDARNSRAAAPAYNGVAMWTRPVHTGDIWGWPSRVVMAAASLVLPIMALTGPLIWWTRRRPIPAAAARPALERLDS